MINLFSVNMSPGVEVPLAKTIASGNLTQGEKVEEFENEFKSFFPVKNFLSLNSGTSALTLACRLAGVEGRYVISTPMTCSATNEAILAAGGKILWADVDPRTGLIDPESVEYLYKKSPHIIAAVMCVDWGGMPCDIAALREATKHAIPVIEDAAHSLGSVTKVGNLYRMVGTQADYTCFSFQAIKHLTTVDGGGLVCLSDRKYVKAKKLRWFGIDRTIETDFRGGLDIEDWGYKFHMNDVNATIGLHNLKNIHLVFDKHNTIARQYYEELSDLPMQLPPESSTFRSSYWLFTILSNRSKDIMEHLKNRNIQSSKVHARNDKFSCFSSFRFGGLVGLDKFYNDMFCIPINNSMDRHKVDRVISAIEEFFLQ